MTYSLRPEERDHLRRLVAGYEEVNAFVAAERRARTEMERWHDSNQLHSGPLPENRQPVNEKAGIVEQQRLFAQVARR